MTKAGKLIAFDHHSREHTRTWVDTYRHLRANCPIAWTESHGGYWVITRLDDVVTIAQDTENFTKRKWQDGNGTWRGGGTIPTMSGLLIPDDIDPPEWKYYRHLLNPWFTPKTVAHTRAMAELVASLLVDAVIETGQVEMIDQLASPLPTIMTLQMLGMPLEDWREYAEPSHEAVYTVPGTPAYKRAVQRLQWGEAQMGAALKARRGNSGKDLISHITNTQTPDGEYLTDTELMGICRQVLGGGADTTTSLLGNVFIHLSKHPEARQRLRDDPKVAPFACEEFLRFFTPIHSSVRNVRTPVTIAGTRLEPGERAFIAYASANRDERYFDDPDTVKLDRFPNPHIGFGAGVHRCLGSHMARLSFSVLVNEVLRRIPDFRILEDQAEQYGTTGVVNGWVKVPAAFTPGWRENRDPELAKRLRLGS
jgi:cytochrome P450